jgi:type II secretory pathway pseudopilin PulG
MRSGTTLLELAVVLLLIGIAGVNLVPAARAQADRAAVAGAREAAAALVARTRTEAMLLGGATLHARVADRSLWIQSGDSLVAVRRLGDEFGVTLTLGGTATAAELPFDALGLGRRASGTLIFRRGSAEARLVVAAYGRAVRS